LGGHVKGRPPIVLVTGGARSGKSRFALARGESLGSPRVFLATAEAQDEEMAARIARHRAERGRRWRTVEEPLAITAVLRRPQGGVVLIDCLTLWLANQMGDGPKTNVLPAVDELVEALCSRRSAVVAVTNEVGLGIVPENALARAFRDATGFLNQRVGAIADEVFLLVAGQALRIK
jgi:adenosylcobinamide kinase / adenosylcobinamide-phosphate guanylyltransferase